MGAHPPVLPRFCYHLAEEDNWASIQRFGLLSASMLMARAGLRGPSRVGVEQSRREQRTLLSDGTVLRDNKPLPVGPLERCLVGMKPTEWFALLNSKVFFWFHLDRLERQRRACGPHPQVVMVFETDKLLEGHSAAAAVTPINTGNAMRTAASRGAGTFTPVVEWRNRQWAAESTMTGKLRPPSHVPVELAINEAVPEALRLISASYHLLPDEPLQKEIGLGLKK